MKKLFKTLALTLALVLPFAAMAQEETAKTTINVGGDESSPNIAWTVTAEENEDGNFVVTFDGAIKEGYHGYPMTDFSAPIFDFEGVEVVGDVVETLTPEEHGVDELGLPSFIYEHQAIYIHTIKAKPGQKVNAYVGATICTNDTNQCTSNTCEFVITMPGTAVEAAAETAADDASTASALDWGSIITAILWGFAALMTPCVFPMVPMTVSFFVKGSQSPAQGRLRALMYGIFIVALYVLPIAIIMSLTLFGIDVSGDIFNFIGTHWIPNLIFFLIFMVFAASFFGAFEITLPSSLVNKSDEGADKGGLIGIFFMALTLVLVSFSCTGPIVGNVIIEATSGSTNIWMPIITMAAFAIAFALPFTLLAWFPALLKNLPKSGGWLNSVKEIGRAHV